MKKILLAVGLLLCASVAFGAEKTVKIGYIDLQRALDESDAGKDAKITFNKRVEELNKILGERDTELRKLQDEMEKQKGFLTDDARKEKEKVFQQKLKDTQRYAKDVQEELQQKETELANNIFKNLMEVIKKIGPDEGYTIILEKGRTNVLYAADGIDITDKVIKTYNKMRK